MSGASSCSVEAGRWLESDRGSLCGRKYALRPRTARRLHEGSSHQDPFVVSGKRTKAKAAPLSRYRRKTANARERYRMRKINTAFDSLRNILPSALAVKPASTSSTLTKITTLRLAVSYIRALSKVLEEEENTTGFCSIDGSFESIPAPAQESLFLNTHFPPLQDATFSSVSQWALPWVTQLPLLSPSCKNNSSTCASSSSYSSSSAPPQSQESPTSPCHEGGITPDDSSVHGNHNLLLELENLSSFDTFDIL
ncbi:helix-loop-helix protein delilah-like [Eriocheir sinensis]|uniref:helix-loop-helix protein delilah-like n=1 Tax=Eriocheir sinensis TaxID=95602 RepID=UPI0021C91397|nr:helix-loop-helix protein delilah-like [Eriocheir sinensis]